MYRIEIFGRIRIIRSLPSASLNAFVDSRISKHKQCQVLRKSTAFGEELHYGQFPYYSLSPRLFRSAPAVYSYYIVPPLLFQLASLTPWRICIILIFVPNRKVQTYNRCNDLRGCVD